MSTSEESPAKWALDLFDHPPVVQDHWLDTNYGYIVAPLVAATAPIIRNTWLHRPYYAGIQYHIACAIAGFGFAVLMENWDVKVRGMKNGVLRHYVSLYPERFPEPPRQKFSEVLNAWRPVR